ncbi:MAG: type I methionyl aminopeptidase [Dehalococcoidales bacterium]|nr:type I methionyl aminopeptidase [Dehalococcoidales bacterium]
MGIVIKSEKEIEIMRQSGRIVADILKILSEIIKPGMKTKEMDIIAESELKKRSAESSFRGYRGYPATICASVNDEIVHGIPGDRVLKEGDIISLDFGAIYQGFHGDAAVTVPVGKVSDKTMRLIETTKGTLKSGIAAARAGVNLGDVSAAIEEYAKSRGYSLVREYTGHGIGRKMHEDPQIPNTTEPPYGLQPGTGPVLKKGMTLALEPMLNIGDWRTRVAEDHWTVLTADGSLSAHFEHTIVINDTEPEVLTGGWYD